MVVSSTFDAGRTVQSLQLLCVRDHDQALRRLETIADRTRGEGLRREEERVEAILQQVRTGGDAGRLGAEREIDGVRPDPLRIPRERLERAWKECAAPLRQALELAHGRILSLPPAPVAG